MAAWDCDNTCKNRNHSVPAEPETRTPLSRNRVLTSADSASLAEAWIDSVLWPQPAQLYDNTPSHPAGTAHRTVLASDPAVPGPGRPPLPLLVQLLGALTAQAALGGPEACLAVTCLSLLAASQHVRRNCWYAFLIRSGLKGMELSEVKRGDCGAKKAPGFAVLLTRLLRQVRAKLGFLVHPSKACRPRPYEKRAHAFGGALAVCGALMLTTGDRHAP
jgi:hypothetical protein